VEPSNIGFRCVNWVSLAPLLAVGFMVLVPHTWAAGVSAIFEDEKFYFSSLSPCGDKLQSSALWDNNKDKVLIEAPIPTKPDGLSITVCLHSDLLTCIHKRIYKSQNDP
jgi:hypothetical protein